MASEFQCFRRIDKADYFGTLSLSPDQLIFSCSTDPKASQAYPMSTYAAQRTHPKLPMVQLRFTKEQQSTDMTLFFKHPVTGAHDFERLKQFIDSLRGTCIGATVFQPVGVAPAPASSTSGAPTSDISVKISVPISSSSSTPTAVPIGPQSPIKQSVVPPTVPQSIASVSAATPGFAAPRTERLRPPSSDHATPESRALHSAVLQQLQQERERLLEIDEDLKGAYDVGRCYLPL